MLGKKTPQYTSTPAVSGEYLEEQVLRRSFWLFAGLISVLLLPYLFIWIKLKVWISLAVCSGLLATNMGCVLAVRSGRLPTVRRPLGLLLAVLYAVLSLTALVQGGPQAPALRWMSVLPVIVLMSGLSGQGMALLLVLLLQGGWMMAYPDSIWPELRQHLLPYPEQQLFWSSIGSLLLLTFFGWMTMRWRHEAYRALDIARAQAIEGEARKERYLATMSHEIRTPLNGIVGVSSMLKNPSLGDAERTRLTRLMDQSARALLETLNNVLDWTKMNHGPMPMAPGPITLSELVQETIDLFAPMCQAKGLALRSEIAQGVPPQVLGDKLRLQQMLNNLLSNAIKFTSQGHIRILIKPD